VHLGDFPRFLLCQSFTSTPAKLGHPAHPTTTSMRARGKISYGTVAGATTQAAAMSKILIGMQNTCGERPQIGKSSSSRERRPSASSLGDRSLQRTQEGGRPGDVGRLWTQQVEAALLFNDASRFGKTVNPMLQKTAQRMASREVSLRPRLLGWRAIGFGRQWHSASSARLHTATAPDNSQHWHCRRLATRSE